MRGFWLRGVALPALVATPALAADLPTKAPPAPPVASTNWTGFYAGLNAGGDWAYSGDPSTSTSCAPGPGFGFSYFTCASVPLVNATGTGSMSGSGFTGGVQAGYNWQSSSTVVGVETDFESFHGKASRTATASSIASGAGVPGPAAITSSVDATWLFTARGRLGWAVNNNLLAYATGGLAVTHLSAANSYSDAGGAVGVGVWNASATKAGWTVGAGVEYSLSQHWSARAEYLYVHFDALTATGSVASTVAGAYGSAISTSTDLSAHIARAGVNYKF